MYFSNENAIHIPFECHTNNRTAEGVALIDSGATHNFMDRRMVKRLQVGTKELAIPRNIRNVDGTNNKDGTLTRYTDLQVTVNKQTQIQRFYITDLAEDRALFGFPWLQEFNPRINWKEREIDKTKVTIRTTNLEPSGWAQISRILFTGRLLARKAKTNQGDEIHMVVNKTNLAQQWAEAAHKGKETMTASTIPKQYKEYTKVFSEEAARRFPPEREDDHAIKFKEGTPDTFSCKIYPISTPETNFLRDWIDENLQKEFIRESKSPYASPTFLIKKKNGDYRVIQDYRTLNAWTVPDTLPLPLIAPLIEKLHRKTLFTKFDIR